MTYAFPSDLAERIADRWHTFVHREGPTPAIPPLNELRHILETVFFASLEREEGRPLRFSVCCVASLAVEREGSSERPLIIPFSAPRSLTVDVLRSLAPAVRPDAAAILVQLTSAFENTAAPQIVGVLHVGSDLVRARAGKSFYYQPPPYALNIDVRGPGELHVYQGAIKLATLESGRLHDQVTASALDIGVAGDLLAQGERALSPRIIPPEHEPEREWAEFQWIALLNTVLSIVNMIKAHGHGGTVLLVGPTAGSHVPVKLKYETNYDTNFLDDRFVGFINARHRFADALFMRENTIPGTPSEDDISKLELAVLAFERELSDAAETVATFSCVDGALVLTTALRLVGFGAEILLEKAQPTKVYEVTGLPLVKSERPELDSEDFGMRHRSAVRFVGATNEAVAFIVSQDGTVSFCWREGSQVYMKRGVNISNPNMAGA